MISIGNPWVYFLEMSWLLIVADLLARRHPANRQGLNVPMESLRGLLATGVFFCHSVVTFIYFQTGIWTSPPSAFYAYLGTGTVDLFFLISGFLFWSKCIAEGGIRQTSDFWVSRARRLIPAYYASLILITLIVFAHTRLSIRVPLHQLCLEFLSWLAFCVPNLRQPLNGITQAPLINAVVIWTLQLEIVFYAFLPLLYRIFNGYRVFMYLALCALIYWYFGPEGSLKTVSWAEDPVPRLLARFFGFGFGFGMLVAFLKSKCPAAWLESFSERRWSVIPVLFLAGPVLLKLPAHSFFQFVCLVVPFIFIVARNDLFGLLSMRSTFLLGQCSYSFYVTHGIVLYVLSHLMNHWAPIKEMLPLVYWLFVAGCATMAVCLADFLYRNAELRFMKRRPALAQAGAMRTYIYGTLL